MLLPGAGLGVKGAPASPAVLHGGFTDWALWQQWWWLGACSLSPHLLQAGKEHLVGEGREGECSHLFWAECSPHAGV